MLSHRRLSHRRLIGALRSDGVSKTGAAGTDQLASIPAAELTVENFTKYATMLTPLVLVDSTAGWELAESLKKNALLEMAG